MDNILLDAKEGVLSELKTLKHEDGSLVFVKDDRILDSEILDCDQAKIVKEHALICLELHDVIFWLEELEELTLRISDDETEVTPEVEKIYRKCRAYYTSAVVTYFKFFTRCYGMVVKPKADVLYSASQLETHKELEVIRNQLMAHIDHSKHFSRTLYALRDPLNKFKPSILPSFIRSNHDNPERLKNFIDLVKFLYSHFDAEYEASGKILMHKIFG